MESIVLDVFQSSIATHKMCAEGLMQRSNSMQYEYIYIYIYNWWKRALHRGRLS